MNELQAQYDKLVQDQRKLKEEFRVTAQELFKQTTKEFFEKNPGITAFIWTQYTPYFNDGDACVFSVGSPTFTNAPEDELDNVNHYGEYDGEEDGIWSTDSLSFVLAEEREWYKKERDLILAGAPIDAESVERIQTLIGSEEMEDVMEIMFGDGVIVRATRNGFDVEEYDHD